MHTASTLKSRSRRVCGIWLALAALAISARADVLISTNGERFVGTIIAETTNTVVFESQLGGRLTLVPAQIRKLERTAAFETNAAPVPAPAATKAATRPASTNLSWVPPGIGHDGADWVQLKSGEWLRGELKYIQHKDVEFDSDELEEQSLKLKDIRQVYTAHRMLAQVESQEPVYGIVVVSNDVVTVKGTDSTVSLAREELMGITPGGGGKSIKYWSGNVQTGISLQSGNNSQKTINTSAELARRTPATTLLLEYLGNYSQVDDVKNANNNRGNLTYDIRLNRAWFVRPLDFECYHDPLINIAYRLTGGVGAGYYIFDNPGLEWRMSAGPGFQYTRFDTVEAGESESASTAAGTLQSYFEYDLTRRLTFKQLLQSTFTDRKAGLYTHHTISTLEFEIKHHLDLDVSFIWDYLQRPRPNSDGDVPERSDYYLTVGFGVRF
jgi:putative salt-induced outer membrane protein YdiY